MNLQTNLCCSGDGSADDEDQQWQFTPKKINEYILITITLW